MDRNRLKDELFNYKSSVNIDEIWSAIEPDVDAINAEKKRKRRAGFFWLFGAGSMLLVFLFLSYNFYKKQSQVFLSTTTAVPDKNIVDNNEDIIAKETSGVVANVNDNSTSNHNIVNGLLEEQGKLYSREKTDVTTDVGRSISKDEVVASVQGELEVSSSDIVENSIAPKTWSKNYNKNITDDLILPKKEIFSGEKKKVVGRNIVRSNGQQGENVGEVVAQNAFDEKRELSAGVSEDIVIENELEEEKDLEFVEDFAASEMPIASEGESIVDSVGTKNVHVVETVVSIDEEVDAVGEEVIAEPINETVVVGGEMDIEENVDTVALALEEALPADDAKHGGGHHDTWKFAVGVEVGIAVSNKTLTVKDSLSEALLALRNDTERSLEATHIGLNVSLGHKSGFEFSTGIHYTRIAEFFEYNETRVKYDSIENAIEFYYINLDEEQVPVYGTIPNNTTISEVQKIYNYFHLVDIPLSVAYHYELEKFSVGLETSLLVNLALKTKGRIFGDTEFSQLDLKTKQETVYKSSAGLSFLVGVPLRYHLTDKMDLSLKPYWRKFPKNFAVDNYGLEQRYGLLGLDLGMRWRF